MTIGCYESWVLHLPQLNKTAISSAADPSAQSAKISEYVENNQSTNVADHLITHLKSLLLELDF